MALTVGARDRKGGRWSDGRGGFGEDDVRVERAPLRGVVTNCFPSRARRHFPQIIPETLSNYNPHLSALRQIHPDEQPGSAHQVQKR